MAYNNSVGSAGKLLGGTSAIDDMLYLRGNPGDFQSWATDENSNWSYDNILSYFKKSEKNGHSPFFKRKKNKIHSEDGLLRVNYFNTGDNSAWAIKEAFRELKHELINDFSAKVYNGYGNAQAYIHNGIRESAAKAFLIPAKDRPNLHVIKNGLATQILFDEDDPEVVNKTIGVKFYVAGKRFRAFVKKEVIVSAGAIGTPKLLMLSGIGPSKNIKKLGVKVIQNLPVGDNLQDLATVPLFIKFNTSSVLDGKELLDHLYNYLGPKVGMFTHIGALEFLLTINTTDQDATYPNVQFKHNIFSVDDIRLDGMYNSLSLKEPIENELRELTHEFDTLFVNVVLLKPKSRGKAKLRSKQSMDPLKIELNYLHAKQDMDTMLSGIRSYLKVLNTKSMKDYASLIKLNLDVCNDFEYDSDAYWECYIRYFITSSHHFVGTAKMGLVKSRKTVVDHLLKVKNVEGLRVIDASIMPEIISGGTTATTLMIAEMGSDFIKETWKN